MSPYIKKPRLSLLVLCMALPVALHFKKLSFLLHRVVIFFSYLVTLDSNVLSLRWRWGKLDIIGFPSASSSTSSLLKQFMDIWKEVRLFFPVHLPSSSCRKEEKRSCNHFPREKQLFWLRDLAPWISSASRLREVGRHLCPGFVVLLSSGKREELDSDEESDNAISFHQFIVLRGRTKKPTLPFHRFSTESFHAKRRSLPKISEREAECPWAYIQPGIVDKSIYLTLHGRNPAYMH